MGGGEVEGERRRGRRKEEENEEGVSSHGDPAVLMDRQLW